MRTVGVEEELLVVDLSAGYPTPRFDELAAAVRARLGNDDLVEHEFKLEQAEIASAPHLEVAGVLADLRARRSALAQVARPHGLGVAALGSSPLRVDASPTQDDRYAQMHAEFGLLAARQLTCGAHVHVGVESAAEGVAVLDRIRPWLAVLVALCANSPYWDGEDSGYASYRSMVWGQWPTAGPTGAFGDEQGYRRTIEELIGTDTILDTGMLYFDARLSAHYPTVEVRVADVCLEVEDAAVLAALTRGMVAAGATAARAGRPAPERRTELLRVANWRAARSGTTGDLVDLIEDGAPRARSAVDVVDHLVDVIGAELREAGDDRVVRDGVARVFRRGNGADHQRAVGAATQDLRSVVLDAVRATEPTA